MADSGFSRAASSSQMIDGCSCPACSALAERYASDPGLLTFCRKKLLIRGWAGRTDKVEKAYILAHAPWAQRAAEVGSRNLAQVSKAHDRMPSGERVVSQDLDAKTTPERCPRRSG